MKLVQPKNKHFHHPPHNWFEITIHTSSSSGDVWFAPGNESAALHLGPVKEAPRFGMPATQCCGPVTGGNLGLYSLSNENRLSEA
jgi:hypothetical protein